MTVDLGTHFEEGLARAEPSVLVVDDNDDIRNLTVMLLQLSGFTNLYSARDGREALEVLSGNKVDVMFSDINMPGMDGFELIRAVRSDARYAHMPAIFHSGYSKNEGPIMASGATAFLLKAKYKSEDLIALIRSLAPQPGLPEAGPGAQDHGLPLQRPA